MIQGMRYTYSLGESPAQLLLLPTVVGHVGLAVGVADTPTLLTLVHAPFLVPPVHLQLAEAALVLATPTLQRLKLVGGGELSTKLNCQLALGREGGKGGRGGRRKRKGRRGREREGEGGKETGTEHK